MPSDVGTRPRPQLDDPTEGIAPKRWVVFLALSVPAAIMWGTFDRAGWSSVIPEWGSAAPWASTALVAGAGAVTQLVLTFRTLLAWEGGLSRWRDSGNRWLPPRRAIDIRTFRFYYLLGGPLALMIAGGWTLWSLLAFGDAATIEASPVAWRAVTLAAFGFVAGSTGAVLGCEFAVPFILNQAFDRKRAQEEVPGPSASRALRAAAAELAHDYDLNAKWDTARARRDRVDRQLAYAKALSLFDPADDMQRGEREEVAQALEDLRVALRDVDDTREPVRAALLGAAPYIARESWRAALPGLQAAAAATRVAERRAAQAAKPQKRPRGPIILGVLLISAPLLYFLLGRSPAGAAALPNFAPLMRVLAWLGGAGVLVPALFGALAFALRSRYPGLAKFFDIAGRLTRKRGESGDAAER